jgi:hypothetical protein
MSGKTAVTIQRLINDGALNGPLSSQELVTRVRETVGDRWKTLHVQTYMKKFLRAGIVRAIKPPHSRRNYWVLASIPKAEALRMIGRSENVASLEETLFSGELLRKLKPNFSHELSELHDNFGRNGNCCAFLLRKILEKFLIITFSKNRKAHLLEDVGRPGGWKGLKDMIEVASREKLSGLPFLSHRTAAEIKGMKFLGDTAAHNPLVGVDMTTIVPQMPFLITSFKELAERL